MKKLFVWLIAVFAIFAIVACDPATLPEEPEENTKPVEMTGLDAFRHEATTGVKPGKKPKDVDITVSGTVFVSCNDSNSIPSGKDDEGKTIWGKGRIYVVDDKAIAGEAGVLRIDGKKDGLKSGDKVEIKINKIYENHDIYLARVEDSDIKKIGSETSEAPVPTLQFNSNDELINSLGTGTNLAFGKAIVRITGNDKNTYTGYIVAPDDIESEDMTMLEERPDTVKIYKSNSFKAEKAPLIGDLYEFIGVTEQFYNDVTLRAYTGKQIATMPVDEKKLSYDTYYQSTTKTDLEALKGGYVEGYIAGHAGNELFIADPTSNKSIYINSPESKNVTIPVGSKVKFTINEAKLWWSRIQVTSFTIEEYDFAADAMFTHANTYTADEWSALTDQDFLGAERPQVILENVTLDKVDDIYGYNAHMVKADGTETKVLIKDYNVQAIAKADMGKTGTLYGVIGTKHNNSTNKDEVVVFAPKFVENPAN